eukprot:Sspe_Gene.73846::Locus_45000_Transcript_1_2_Confidence_0.667_Length_5142::g.73846::m.73846
MTTPDSDEGEGAVFPHYPLPPFLSTAPQARGWGVQRAFVCGGSPVHPRQRLACLLGMPMILKRGTLLKKQPAADAEVPKGGGGAPVNRFWEAGRVPKEQWSYHQRAVYSKVKEYILANLPPEQEWMRGEECLEEIEGLLTECLEVSCHYKEEDEGACLKRWLYVCDHSAGDAEGMKDLRSLKRKVDEVRVRTSLLNSEPSGSELSEVPRDRKLDKVFDPQLWGHFLYPKEMVPVEIPDIFQGVSEWVQVLRTNLLAEYWHLVHSLESRTGGHRSWLTADCVIKGASEAQLVIPEGSFENAGELIHQLFRFSDDGEAVFRLVTSARSTQGYADQLEKERPATVTFKFTPPLSLIDKRSHKKVHMFAYIGSHLLELSAIESFSKVMLNPETNRIEGLENDRSANVLRSILDPAQEFPGRWQHDSPLDPSQATPKPYPNAKKLNESQRVVLDSLKNCLEVIHGPPGTGKSTTISHLICERLPSRERVIVTCTRNGAVDSITEKIQGRVPIVVVGSKGTVGEVANRWRVPEQLCRHTGFQQCSAIYCNFMSTAKQIATVVGRYETRVREGKGRRLLLRYCLAKSSPAWRLLLLVHDFCVAKQVAATASLGALRLQIQREIWANARVFLCTISASVRLYTEYAQCHEEEQLVVDTVIIDECGCTPE